MRYIRAFFIALQMTLRGERPPVSPYAPLIDWTRKVVKLVDAVYAAANQQGIDKAARQKMTLQIERRDMRVETILATVRHHAVEEYPNLLKSGIEHHLTAIYASNLNDRYYVSRLREISELQGESIQNMLQQLSAHLDAIPPMPTKNA